MGDIVWADMVGETTAKAGTGNDYDLEGTFADFRTFADGVGDTYDCYVRVSDGIADWEIMRVTVDEGGGAGGKDQLEVVSRIATTNGGSAVNWASSGTRQVVAVTPASIVEELAGKGQFKMGTFSRNMTTASGDQAITGVGFQPSAVLVIAADAGTAAFSIGFSDGSSEGHLFDAHNNSANTWDASSGSIYMATGSNNDYSGSISSLDSDGFTITWTRTNTPTGTIDARYFAFR